MSDRRPIGVFDSGLGGLTVVRAIIDDLPSETVVYFGDTARFPYGPRSIEELRVFAVEIARHLLVEDVKLIVVACNSATAAALDEVTAAVPVPVIGVIEPAVRAAIRATRNGRVGLIGTVATVESRTYQRAFGRLAPHIEVLAQATSSDLIRTAQGYLGPLKEAGVDTVILGCTHYPLLRGAIHHVMGDDVLLLSSADETASDVYEVLARDDLLANGDEGPVHRFQSSGDPAWFATLGRRFLGPEFNGAVQVSLQPVGST